MREPDKARCWEAVVRTTCAACLDRHDDGHGQARVPARGADCPVRTSVAVVMDVECPLHAYLEEDAHLVVVGAHSRRPGMAAMVGSCADRIVRELPCPVLAVPSPVPALTASVLHPVYA